MSTDRPTPVDATAPLRRPHSLLVAERRSRGWGRGRLAVEFELAARELDLRAPERPTLVKAIYRHETGRAELRDELYVRLYCAVYDLSRHELLGTAATDVMGPASWDLTSHKFIPIHLGGPEGAELVVVRSRGLSRGAALGVECQRGTVPHPAGAAELFVFPWGVASLHLAEELSVPSLATVAAWRRRTGAQSKAWAADVIREVMGSVPVAHYVMSAYWLDSPPWSEPTLTTAMRLLAKPRVLLGRPDGAGEPSVAHAEQLERALLRDGFDDSRIDGFGVQGLSVGCASWAAVSYCSLSAPHALRSMDLVELQALVQALWCHCHHLREQVERGDDPTPAPGYGWRWLRAMRSRLTIARPNESAQHAALRESVLATSGLAEHLVAALDLLRDTDRS